MTKGERALPDNNFIEAGQTACNMGIKAASNPYKGEHQTRYHNLWRTGYERGMQRRITPVRFDWQEL